MDTRLSSMSSLQLRNYCGLTQFAYAVMLGVSQSSVSQREQSSRPAEKWEVLAVKGALFSHNGLSGCLCRYCHKSRLDAVYSR